MSSNYGLPQSEYNFIASDSQLLDYNDSIIFKWDLNERCNRTGIKDGFSLAVYKKLFSTINAVSVEKLSFQDLLDSKKIEQFKGQSNPFNVAIPKKYKDQSYYSYRISNGKKFCRLIGVRKSNFFTVFMIERSAGDIYNH